jgi:hypothetical protein
MKDIKYKVYFYDRQIKQTYPIVIGNNLKNMCQLASWLNDYTVKFDMEVVGGIIIDDRNIRIADIKFQPCEIMYQYFCRCLT